MKKFESTISIQVEQHKKQVAKMITESEYRQTDRLENKINDQTRTLMMHMSDLLANRDKGSDQFFTPRKRINYTNSPPEQREDLTDTESLSISILSDS